MKLTKLSTLTLVAIILTTFSHGQSQGNPGEDDTGNETRPNIIVIVAESHRADALGVAGNHFIHTPHLNRLANEGIRFNNAYVTTAICVVSRASILSGQHGARHGINDFSSGFSESALRQTLPMILKDNGYELAWLGSFGMQKKPSPDHFSLWQPDIPWMADDVHNTDNVVNQAASWLNQNDREAPFYLQINFKAAHEIDRKGDQPSHYLVQERFKTLYSDIEMPVPKSADPSVWESFPDFFRTNENIARLRWQGFFSTAELLQENSRNYYRLITGLDEAVGTLRATLKKLNLDQNTLIIYTSDHGFSLGEHGLMGKWFPFDVGIRVPLLIYDPRSPATAGKLESGIALNIDIAPTILKMAGLEIPRHMQGMNLIEIVKGHLSSRSSFFYQHTFLGSPSLPAVEAVVTDKLKYIKYIEHGYEALYDREKDPDEMVNLISTPRYQSRCDAMRILYEKERSKAM